MVNVLEGYDDDRWGLAWYDKHARLDGGVLIVGMDFGNEDSVIDQRAKLAQDPDYEPGWNEDRSYARLRQFLRKAKLSTGEPLASRVYVTNAALCVRLSGAGERGAVSASVYRECSRHLLAQINMVKPYFVVALGSEALAAVWQALRWGKYEGRILDDVGRAREFTVNGAVVCVIPFLHPSQGQREWTDQRQHNELYQALADRLEALEVTVPRLQFAQSFDTIPWLAER